MAEEAAANPTDRSRAICVWSAAWLGFLLLLGIFCQYCLAPALRADAVLRNLGTDSPRAVFSFNGLGRCQTYWAGEPERQAAVARLGGPEAATRGLRLYLLLPKWAAPRRAQAAFLLAFCQPRRPDLLVRLTTDADVEVRLWAVRGMFEAAEADPEMIPQAAVPLIARALADPDRVIRCQAAELLREIGPRARPAVPALEVLLAEAPQGPDDELDLVRCHAAMALAKITGQVDAHLPRFVQLLGSANVGAREDAAMALGRMGPRAGAAAPALQKALADTDPWVRCQTALALWRLGADRGQAVPVLLDLLEKDPREGAQRAAAHALGKMGPAAKDAVGALENAARTGHWIVREAAQEALDKIQASGEPI
jgi:HEAT repeat protein